LAVVFLPIIFLQGFVGSLFREFGIVVAGAVLISAFVSLTLTPVLNVLLQRDTHKRSWFYEKTEPFYQSLDNGYREVLSAFMKRRWLAFPILAACVLLFIVIGKNMQSELAPLEDRSVFRLSVSAPEGTSYDYMDRYINRITNFMMDSLPENKIVLSVTAPGFAGSGAVNSGFVRVAPSRARRTRTLAAGNCAIRGQKHG
jgi:multidrug efflux pump